MDSERAKAMKELEEHARDVGREVCQVRTRVVPGSGSVDAPLMVIGEAPAERDESTGQPFSGPAGSMLKGELLAAGIPPEKVYMTNLVKCRATEVLAGRRRNRTPNREEIAEWSGILKEELALVHPRAVLCVGALPARMLAGKGFKVSRDHGKWFAGPGGTHLLGTYNTAHILRLDEPEKGEALAAFRADLAVLSNYLSSPGKGEEQLSLFEG